MQIVVVSQEQEKPDEKYVRSSTVYNQLVTLSLYIILKIDQSLGLVVENLLNPCSWYHSQESSPSQWAAAYKDQSNSLHHWALLKGQKHEILFS